MAELRISNVPERLRIALRIIALEDRTTLNALVIRALEELVQRRKPARRAK